MLCDKSFVNITCKLFNDRIFFGSFTVLAFQSVMANYSQLRFRLRVHGPLWGAVEAKTNRQTNKHLEDV